MDFLAFFVATNLLAFLSAFPFFPRDFRGLAEREGEKKILVFLGVVSLALQQETKIRGVHQNRANSVIAIANSHCSETS